jgi:hypothetical protein
MPNWCKTEYICTSKRREDLDDLYEKIEHLNEIGHMLLGDVVSLLGGNNEKIECQGQWLTHDYIDEIGYHFETMTAWDEMNEFRHFIESKYPEMKIYYQSTEFGNKYFVTNDKDGTYFKNRYGIVHSNDSTDFYKDYYFATKEETITTIEKIIGRKLTEEEMEIKNASDWTRFKDGRYHLINKNNWMEEILEEVYYFKYKIIDD